VYEAIKGRFVSSFYFLFTVLFLFHLLLCSLLLISLPSPSLLISSCSFDPYSLTSSLIFLLLLLSSFTHFSLPTLFSLHISFSYSLFNLSSPFRSLLSSSFSVSRSGYERAIVGYGLGRGSIPGSQTFSPLHSVETRFGGNLSSDPGTGGSFLEG
jgi:hypothetical protein